MRSANCAICEQYAQTPSSDNHTNIPTSSLEGICLKNHLGCVVFIQQGSKSASMAKNLTRAPRMLGVWSSNPGLADRVANGCQNFDLSKWLCFLWRYFVKMSPVCSLHSSSQDAVSIMKGLV